MQARSVLLTALVIAITVCALGVVVAVIAPRSIPDAWMITMVLFSAYTLGAFLAVLAARRMRRTRNACLAFTGVSFVFAIGGVWAGELRAWGLTEWCFALSFITLFVALALLHRMILAPIAVRTPVGRVAQRTALIAGPLTAGWMVLTLLAYTTDNADGEGWLQIGAIGLVVAAAASAIAGLVRAFESKPDPTNPGALPAGVLIRLTCPRCQNPLGVRPNTKRSCASCGLRVLVEVEEPRCVCGYLLYQLERDICPECGRPVTSGAWNAPERAAGDPPDEPDHAMPDEAKPDQANPDQIRIASPANAPSAARSASGAPARMRCV